MSKFESIPVVASAVDTNGRVTTPAGMQAQTNPVTTGLRSNWAALAGAALTNQFVIPINKTNGTVFFRMTYP